MYYFVKYTYMYYCVKYTYMYYFVKYTYMYYFVKYTHSVLALIFFIARKPNLEKFSIYSNKFFHNFHLSKSSFTCPRLWESGLELKKKTNPKIYMKMSTNSFTILENLPSVSTFGVKYLRLHQIQQFDRVKTVVCTYQETLQNWYLQWDIKLVYILFILH
jgi:hypothetical protein